MRSTHSALYTPNWSKNLSQGKSSLVAKLRHRIYDPLSKVLFSLIVGQMKVKIQKRDYRYLAHWYNFTWTNERAIEVPFFQRLVGMYSAPKILEVGNTLSHYQSIKHTIVDKYETGPDVHNIDVLEFRPRGKFDLIIAISTLEHVGWHEKEKRPEKAIEAIDHLTSLLSPKGRLVVSFPIGVNPALDTMLRENSLPHAKTIFLRRKNRMNIWEESTYNSVKMAKYNRPYPNANAICILTLSRDR